MTDAKLTKLTADLLVAQRKLVDAQQNMKLIEYLIKRGDVDQEALCETQREIAAQLGVGKSQIEERPG
jgi:hypothetical protein